MLKGSEGGAILRVIRDSLLYKKHRQNCAFYNWRDKTVRKVAEAMKLVIALAPKK